MPEPHIRLDELTPYWSGKDTATPAGHTLVFGRDTLGLLRLCLYKGDAPSDSTFRGSLLIPPDNHTQKYLPSRTTAYGPTGAYVTSQGDSISMLHRLATKPSTEQT